MLARMTYSELFWGILLTKEEYLKRFGHLCEDCAKSEGERCDNEKCYTMDLHSFNKEDFADVEDFDTDFENDLWMYGKFVKDDYHVKIIGIQCGKLDMHYSGAMSIPTEEQVPTEVRTRFNDFLKINALDDIQPRMIVFTNSEK
jgi:hypothetical protein